MNSITRVLKSRAIWKRKATKRADDQRELRKTARRLRTMVDRLSRENKCLKQVISAQKKGTPDLIDADKTELSVTSVDGARLTQILCVSLVINAVVSFRSVPRILESINSTKGTLFHWVPHFTSVINWTLRVGLAMLQQVSVITEPWIAIVDCSIDVSVKKMLVVLRVKLSTLQQSQGAITLSDCQCIGLKVEDRWTGANVASALSEIFNQAGKPVAILKDEGKDLSLGVKIWKKNSQTGNVHVISDVGHAMANALKACFASLKGFERFLDTINKGAAKLRQSDLAFLTPPKIRTKGRFQSITKLADWAVKILDIIKGSGRSEDGTIQQRIRKFLPGFGAHRPFLTKFAETCRVATEVLAILKNSGLNQNSFREVRQLLESLPERSIVRRRMLKWLNRHLSIQARLGIGQLPLLVSSDIIETLFGKLKVILQRNPKAEFNRIALAVPCLCGELTKMDFASALQRISHTELMKWDRDNVGESQAQKRRRFFGINLDLQNHVRPKTGKSA